MLEGADEGIGQGRELRALDLDLGLRRRRCSVARKTREMRAELARRSERAEGRDAPGIAQDLGREEVRGLGAEAFEQRMEPMQHAVRDPLEGPWKSRLPSVRLVAHGVDRHAEVRATHRVVTYRARRPRA